MPYPNELHIKKSQIQKLQEVIRKLGNRFSAEELINSGVSVELGVNDKACSVENMLRFVSDCAHKAASNGSELFQVNFSSDGNFEALFIGADGCLITDKGVRLFHMEMMEDCVSDSIN